MYLYVCTLCTNITCIYTHHGLYMKVRGQRIGVIFIMWLSVIKVRSSYLEPNAFLAVEPSIQSL